MNKKARGGQRKHWAEKARVLAWYTMVRRESGLNDYQLDFDFAWRDSALGERVSGNARPRTFEWIRKTGRQPKGADQRWRSMEMLVEAVDQDMFLRGTAALYNAPIWDLFQKTDFQSSELSDRLNGVLTKHGLVLKNPLELSGYDELEKEFTQIGLFDRCVCMSLRNLNRTERLELLWLLYVQASSPHVADYRAVLESILDTQLERFFERFVSDEYLGPALQVLMRTVVSHHEHSWAEFERRAKLLVLPVGFEGICSRNALQPPVSVFMHR